MKVPDEVFNQICDDMDAREQAGEFDQLFKGEIHPREGPGKEEFLHSFSTGMKLYKSTFLKIYGYELSYPGFAEQALSWLEVLGCSKARAYYSGVKVEYEHERDKGLKEVASWDRTTSNNHKKEVRARNWKIKNLTREELTELCQKLLSEGIINEPEQFAMAVLQDL